LGDVDEDAMRLCYKGGGLDSGSHEMCNCGGLYCQHEDSPRDFNIAVDGIESFLLSLAVAGVDVESPAVLEALETSMEKMAQEYDT
jgi:hypothetical protein